MLRSRKSRLIADSRIRHTCRGTSCDSQARGRHRGAVLERADRVRNFRRSAARGLSRIINELRAPPGALKNIFMLWGVSRACFSLYSIRKSTLGLRGRLLHAEWVDARGVAAALESEPSAVLG